MEQQELEKKGEETMPSVSCSRGEGADGARGICLLFIQKFNATLYIFNSV
jgi:hypothetical protein